MFWRALFFISISLQASGPYVAEQLWQARGYLEEGSYLAALHESLQILRSDPANSDAHQIEQEAIKFLVN